jgi:hypothetical protein
MLLGFVEPSSWPHNFDAHPDGLHHEGLRADLSQKPCVLTEQVIAWVGEVAPSGGTEALAGRGTVEDVQFGLGDTGSAGRIPMLVTTPRC